MSKMTAEEAIELIRSHELQVWSNAQEGAGTMPFSAVEAAEAAIHEAFRKAAIYDRAREECRAGTLDYVLRNEIVNELGEPMPYDEVRAMVEEWRDIAARARAELELLEAEIAARTDTWVPGSTYACRDLLRSIIDGEE